MNNVHFITLVVDFLEQKILAACRFYLSTSIYILAKNNLGNGGKIDDWRGI